MGGKVEYVNKTETKEHINIDGIQLMQREDGFYAVPGGGFIKDRGHAEAAARGLVKSNTKLRQEKLAAKRVTRINAGSREGVDMVLGA